MADGTVMIVVTGDPRGKGRPRFARVGNFVRTYTDEKTEVYEGTIKALARSAMKGREPFRYSVRVDVCAHMAIPPSWPSRKREAARAGRIRPTGKPDIDNIFKCLGDACNKVVWEDDSQIVQAAISKRYGDDPRLVIMVEPIADQAADFEPRARGVGLAQIGMAV